MVAMCEQEDASAIGRGRRSMYLSQTRFSVAVPCELVEIHATSYRAKAPLRNVSPEHQALIATSNRLDASQLLRQSAVQSRLSEATVKMSGSENEVRVLQWLVDTRALFPGVAETKQLETVVSLNSVLSFRPTFLMLQNAPERPITSTISLQNRRPHTSPSSPKRNVPPL